MTAVIIQAFILVFLISLQAIAWAQDMFVQAPPIGNSSPLMPITLKVVMNDNDFSAIAWRGLTVQFPRLNDTRIIKSLPKHIDRTLFNSFCTKPVYDEQHTVRDAWKETFGFDVWYPYYRAKEVEGWVKKKVSVKVFKLKGEPIIERGRLMYTFKTRF